MKQEILRALFVSRGRIFGVRGLLAIGSVGTLCILALAGKTIPEGLSVVTAGIVGFYFRDRVK